MTHNKATFVRMHFRDLEDGSWAPRKRREKQQKSNNESTPASSTTT